MKTKLAIAINLPFSFMYTLCNTLAIYNKSLTWGKSGLKVNKNSAIYTTSDYDDIPLSLKLYIALCLICSIIGWFICSVLPINSSHNGFLIESGRPYLNKVCNRLFVDGNPNKIGYYVVVRFVKQWQNFYTFYLKKPFCLGFFCS